MRRAANMRRAADRAVAVQLYRALYRIARTYDTDPALRALLTAPPSRLYDPTAGMWHVVAMADNRGLGAFQRAYLSGASMYRPMTVMERPTMAAFLRSSFDSDATCANVAQSSRLDAGFAALAFLSELAEVGGMLPRSTPSHAPTPSCGPYVASRLNSGTLLIAPPAQLCPSLGRSVVLLLEHSASAAPCAAPCEPSSFGIVLNKPSPYTLRQAVSMLGGRSERSSQSVSAIADDLGGLAANVLHIGGPVAAPLLVLHPFGALSVAATAGEGADPAAAEYATRVAESLRRCHTASDLHASPLSAALVRGASELIASGQAEHTDFKIVLGTTTWGHGQLEGEWHDACWYACEWNPHEVEQPSPSGALAARVLGQPKAHGDDEEAAQEAYARALALLRAHAGGPLGDDPLVDAADAEATVRERTPDASNDDAPGAAAIMLDTALLSGRGTGMVGIGSEEGCEGGGDEDRSHWLPLAEEMSLEAETPLGSQLHEMHEMCDAEMVSEYGQRAWGTLLAELGGEYASIACLAHAQEEQCLQAWASGEWEPVLIGEWEDEGP